MSEDARAFLVELGVESEAIDATPPEDWYLVQEHLFFGGRPTLTVADAAAAVDLDEAAVRRMWVILGFADPVSGRVFREGDLAMLRLYRDGVAVFGREPVEHFARVIGAAARMMSDAMSALWLDVLGEARAAATPRAHLELALMGGTLAKRIPDDLLAPLLHRHSLDSQVFSAEAGAIRTPELEVAVGFCDLVGSTSLHNAVPADVMGRALIGFEAASHDAAVRQGGRVIKLIGDEVMFACIDVAAAEKIAAEIVSWVRTDPVLAGARAAIAHGTVVARGGDLYGPTVNLAARLVASAEPGSIVVADPSGGDTVEVRGFDEPVRVRTLTL